MPSSSDMEAFTSRTDMFSAAAIRPGGDAVVDRFHDRLVLGNRLEAVDTGVVSEGLVIPGNDAVGLGCYPKNGSWKLEFAWKLLN